MNYRNEIDGLRAIAVVAVLLFHFFPSLFPLGYLGVDLFFVISGFLISLYIVTEYDKRSFSYAAFYHRRVKRILPVVMLVLVVCSVVSFFMFLPSNLRDYSNSLLSALTFTSNIYFWRNGGYFGLDNSIEPLLHMWSLSVEEQFYIIYPVLIITLLKIFPDKNKVFIVVLMLCLLSFLGSVYFLSVNLSAPVFFLLPGRFWQFGLGVLAAFYYLKISSFHNKYVELLLVIAMLGCFFIDFSYVPSGTGVALLAALLMSRKFSQESLVTFFFLNHYVRNIGLISFSLYLWHWPVVAYINYYLAGEYSYLMICAGIVITFVLSVLSYRFVEVPFRHKLAKGSVYRFVGASALLILLFVSAVRIYDGHFIKHSHLVNLLAEARRSHYYCSLSEYFSYQGARACYIGQANNTTYDVAVLGNSHAQMYAPALERVFAETGHSGIMVPLNSCLPTIDINISNNCLKLANLNFQAVVNDSKVKTVIVATSWNKKVLVKSDGSTIRDDAHMILAGALVSLVKAIEASGKTALLIGPIVVPGTDLVSNLSRDLKFNRITEADALIELKVAKSVFDNRYSNAQTLVQHYLGSKLIKPGEYLCDQKFCYFGNEHLIFFSDSTHLSPEGALQCYTGFLRALKHNK